MSQLFNVSKNTSIGKETIAKYVLVHQMVLCVFSICHKIAINLCCIFGTKDVNIKLVLFCHFTVHMKEQRFRLSLIFVLSV